VDEKNHMQQPLEIVFEDIEPSDAIRVRLNEELAKLEQINSRLDSARVVIAKPHHHQTKGNSYQVRIHIKVAGMKDVIVNHEPGDHHDHDDAYITIRDAFRAARRQLRDGAPKH
jgi:ribosome-associated translation inhibitor RaiA